MKSKPLLRVLKKAAPLMSLVIMVLVLGLLSPHFLTVDNLLAIGLQMSVVAIMAIGQMLVIISAGIDLSVGSLLALSGVSTTLLLAHGVPLVPALLAGLAVGMLSGLISGTLVAYGRIPAFIATLGMMGIARGASLLLTGGVPVFGLPESFAVFGGGRIAGILPVPVVITLVLAAAVHIFLTYRPMGRHLYAIGSNPTAARLSGIHLERTQVKIFALNGALTGLAGIIMASRLSTGQPTAGTGYELDVIAACVIGGASLSGGEGSILGAIIGALIMGVLRNGCNLLDISAFWQQIAIGSIIIIAVFSDQYRKHKMR